MDEPEFRAPPPTAACGARCLWVTVESTPPAEPRRTFALLTDADAYPAIFRRRGTVAGIVEATVRTDAGRARRRIAMTDGAVLDEEILELQPHALHGYQWRGGLRAPFSWLVAAGRARWRFDAHGTGTRVRWSYCFELRTWWVLPVAWLALGPFRRWMRAALATASRALAIGPVPTRRWFAGSAPQSPMPKAPTTAVS